MTMRISARRVDLDGNPLQNLGQATFKEAAAPDASAANTVTLYAKADGKLYSKDDAGTETALGGSSSGAVPSGSVTAYAGSSAPSGWLLCYGQAISRTTYATLFAAIGTAYGTGDGSTTFNIPDLRGRAPFGKDDMGGTAANRLTAAGAGITGTTLGASGGAETVTLTVAQLAAHSHSASTNALAMGSAGSGAPSMQNQDTSPATASVSIGSTGSDSAHQNTPPALVLNYIIKE